MTPSYHAQFLFINRKSQGTLLEIQLYFHFKLKSTLTLLFLRRLEYFIHTNQIRILRANRKHRLESSAGSESPSVSEGRQAATDILLHSAARSQRCESWLNTNRKWTPERFFRSLSPDSILTIFLPTVRRECQSRFGSLFWSVPNGRMNEWMEFSCLIVSVCLSLGFTSIYKFLFVRWIFNDNIKLWYLKVSHIFFPSGSLLEFVNLFNHSSSPLSTLFLVPLNVD